MAYFAYSIDNRSSNLTCLLSKMYVQSHLSSENNSFSATQAPTAQSQLAPPYIPIDQLKGLDWGLEIWLLIIAIVLLIYSPFSEIQFWPPSLKKGQSGGSKTILFVSFLFFLSSFYLFRQEHNTLKRFRNEVSKSTEEELLSRGSELSELGECKKASIIYEQLRKKLDQNETGREEPELKEMKAENYVRLGEAYLCEQAFGRSEQVLENESLNDNESTRFDRAFLQCKVYYYRGKEDASVKSCDQALRSQQESLEENEERAMAWYYRGRSLRKLGRDREDEAQESLIFSFTLLQNNDAGTRKEIKEEILKGDRFLPSNISNAIEQMKTDDGIPVVRENYNTGNGEPVNLDLPEREVPKRIDENRYANVAYPLDVCGDDLDQLKDIIIKSGGDVSEIDADIVEVKADYFRVKLHQVLFDFDSDQLNNVGKNFCKDVMDYNQTPPEMAFASFTTKEKAEEFIRFIKTQGDFRGGRVAEAKTRSIDIP